MLPPECAWILPNGQQCAQFALRGRRFCRAHERCARVEKTVATNRHLRDTIAAFDLGSLIGCLMDTVEDALHHRISPGVQRLIYQCAFDRLQVLLTDARAAAQDMARFPPHLAPAAAGAQTMEDLFGPRFAGIQLPPDLDLNAALSAMQVLNLARSADYRRTPPKTPVTPPPSAASTLTPAP